MIIDFDKSYELDAMHNLCDCSQRNTKQVHRIGSSFSGYIECKCSSCDYTCTFVFGSKVIVSVMMQMANCKVFLYQHHALIRPNGVENTFFNYPIVKFPTELSSIRGKLDKILTLV